MGIKNYTAAPTAALALGLFFTPPVSIAIDAIINTVASFGVAIGNLGFMSPAMGESAALTKKQSDALNTYNNSRSHLSRSWASGARKSIRINGCRTCRDRHSTLHATT